MSDHIQLYVYQEQSIGYTINDGGVLRYKALTGLATRGWGGIMEDVKYPCASELRIAVAADLDTFKLAASKHYRLLD